jgi:hypothetical protein
MARVFLVNPPSPEPVRTPLLSFCHLAASLRAGGHEVALLDASAPHAPKAHGEIRARIAAFAPHLVGLHLKTLHVQPAYALAAELGDHALVAGGPHATIVPDEPLAHGFRWVIRGEGEEALVELADVIDGKREAGSVAGLSWRERGLVRHNPGRQFLTELDRLAPPLTALDLFDGSWYGAPPVPGGGHAPAGILSSRGCPAACTFCSNDVTGRKFRYRSPESVAAEVKQIGEQFGLCGFSFFDDSFAVGRRRVRELCDAIVGIGSPVWWTCTAHPAHLDREVIADMKRAGCPESRCAGISPTASCVSDSRHASADGRGPSCSVSVRDPLVLPNGMLSPMTSLVKSAISPETLFKPSKILLMFVTRSEAHFGKPPQKSPPADPNRLKALDLWPHTTRTKRRGGASDSRRRRFLCRMDAIRRRQAVLLNRSRQHN